jgi:hypothetical protein
MAEERIMARLEQIQSLERELLAKLKQDEPKRKDGWDKLTVVASLASAFFTFAIAGLGFYFTNVYQQREKQRDSLLKAQQAELQELQVFVQFMPILRGGDEDAKLAAIKAFKKLSSPELFAIVSEMPSSGVAKGLTELATTAKDPQTRDVAKDLLDKMSPTAGVTKGVAELATSSQNPETRKLAAETLNKICGGARVAVKTLTDDGAGEVNLRPAETTIAALRELPPPATLPADARVDPVEKQVYRLRARLVSLKQETDNDFHLVISDERTGETMLAEIPLPDCAATSSHRTDFEVARDFITKTFGAPARRFTTAPEGAALLITGVGFFDTFHRATGQAPNGIELHPVLSVKLAR